VQVPFMATFMGVPGYDAQVPDVRAEAEQRHRQAYVELLARADALPAEGLDPADEITLACVREAARGAITQIDAELIEFTVGPMVHGPSIVLQLASLTTPTEAAAAEAYLQRCRRMPLYLDGCAERLRAGSARGRRPVTALVATVREQLDGYLASPLDDDPLVAVPAPAGWNDDARAAGWRSAVSEAVRDQVRPAVARYRDAVAELAAAARPDDRPGLAHVPGGEEAYARLVQVHTTLPLTADEVHERGLAALAELREQVTELGSRIGLDSFDEVRDAAANASVGADAEAAMDAARAAVRRAEAALVGWFLEPLPPPCAVEPMSPHLGRAGVPPNYSPPTPDGSRRGTYWFNRDVLGAGAGWDLEATAYHEAVPGHHLQIERMLTRSDLPDLQRLGDVTAHAEGWGLYSELLADEMGLYTDDRQRIGALAMQMFRAARLVVDTGLHARGWSRSHAQDVMRENVPVAANFAITEVDRYIAWPGQALAYYIGMQDILALRAQARARLGERFDIRGFHGAVLDSGALPLPALGRAVQLWVDSVSAP